MNTFNDLKKVFESNNFKFLKFENVEEVNCYLLKTIELTESVSIGGSVTIEEMGIYERLINRGNTVFWHWKNTDKDILKKAMNTDIYLTSANAITKDGKIINVDGTGNRVSSIIYGPKRVYIIVGNNKLVDNYEKAIERIKNIAGPMNAKRLNRNTPCTISGTCSDCNSEERICNIETVLHKNPGSTKITICFINKELGY